MINKELEQKIEKEKNWLLEAGTNSYAYNIDIAFDSIKKAIQDTERFEKQPCDDAVSKKALDDAISGLTYWHYENGRLITGGGGSKAETVYKVDDVMRLTHILPPVTPQQKTGLWIDEKTLHGWDGKSYQCSECGRSIHLDLGAEDLNDYPYCHCGAKMKVEVGSKE